jgi:hypothetical protein
VAKTRRPEASRDIGENANFKFEPEMADAIDAVCDVARFANQWLAAQHVSVSAADIIAMTSLILEQHDSGSLVDRLNDFEPTSDEDD